MLSKRFFNRKPRSSAPHQALTPLSAADFGTLAQDVQQALQELAQAGRLVIRCAIREETLLVLVEHLLHVEPDPQQTFNTLEQKLQTQVPDLIQADPGLQALRSTSFPVRLYLRIAGYQQPYAFHSLTIAPAPLSRPTAGLAIAPPETTPVESLPTPPSAAPPAEPESAIVETIEPEAAVAEPTTETSLPDPSISAASIAEATPITQAAPIEASSPEEPSHQSPVAEESIDEPIVADSPFSDTPAAEDYPLDKFTGRLIVLTEPTDEPDSIAPTLETVTTPETVTEPETVTDSEIVTESETVTESDSPSDAQFPSPPTSSPTKDEDSVPIASEPTESDLSPIVQEDGPESFPELLRSPALIEAIDDEALPPLPVIDTKLIPETQPTPEGQVADRPATDHPTDSLQTDLPTSEPALISDLQADDSEIASAETDAPALEVATERDEIEESIVEFTAQVDEPITEPIAEISTEPIAEVEIESIPEPETEPIAESTSEQIFTASTVETQAIEPQLLETPVLETFVPPDYSTDTDDRAETSLTLPVADQSLETEDRLGADQDLPQAFLAPESTIIDAIAPEPITAQTLEEDDDAFIEASDITEWIDLTNVGSPFRSTTAPPFPEQPPTLFPSAIDRPAINPALLADGEQQTASSRPAFVEADFITEDLEIQESVSRDLIAEESNLEEWIDSTAIALTTRLESTAQRAIAPDGLNEAVAPITPPGTTAAVEVPLPQPVRLALEPILDDPDSEEFVIPGDGSADGSTVTPTREEFNLANNKIETLLPAPSIAVEPAIEPFRLDKPVSTPQPSPTSEAVLESEFIESEFIESKPIGEDIRDEFATTDDSIIPTITPDASIAASEAATQALVLDDIVSDDIAAPEFTASVEALDETAAIAIHPIAIDPVATDRISTDPITLEPLSESNQPDKAISNLPVADPDFVDSIAVAHKLQTETQTDGLKLEELTVVDRQSDHQEDISENKENLSAEQSTDKLEIIEVPADDQSESEQIHDSASIIEPGIDAEFDSESDDRSQDEESTEEIYPEAIAQSPSIEPRIAATSNPSVPWYAPSPASTAASSFDRLPLEIDTTPKPKKRPSLSTVLLTGAVGLFVLTATTYGLTRPCVLGNQCEPLQQARQLSEQAQLRLQNNPNALEVVDTYDQLTQASMLLAEIPVWSPFHQEAKTLLADCSQRAEILSAVVKALHQANIATRRSLNPPHPIQTWREIQWIWNEAITQLEQVPAESPVYPLAQNKLSEYQTNLADINSRIAAEQSAQERLMAAKQAADVAEGRSQIINSVDSWQQTSRAWRAIIAELTKIPQGTLAYTEAQRLISLYEQKLEASERRQNEEQLSADAYQKAQSLAEQARNAEQQNQWSQAITYWREAIVTIRQVPEGSVYYSQAQTLIDPYTTALNAAELNARRTVAAEAARPELDRICNSGVRICTYTIATEAIRVQLTPDYDQAVEQAIRSAQSQGEPATRTQALNQVNDILRALASVSLAFNLPVELYNSSGSKFGTYDPEQSGYVIQ